VPLVGGPGLRLRSGAFGQRVPPQDRRERQGRLRGPLAWPQHSNVDTSRRAEYHATATKAICQSLGSGPEVNRCVASSTARRISLTVNGLAMRGMSSSWRNSGTRPGGAAVTRTNACRRASPSSAATAFNTASPSTCGVNQWGCGARGTRATLMWRGSALLPAPPCPLWFDPYLPLPPRAATVYNAPHRAGGREQPRRGCRAAWP
jgi:hypothetical protein